MKVIAAFAILAAAATTSASVHGLYGAVHPYALSPIGPSGIVTGAGAHGPSGTVTGAGAVGPSGIVTGAGPIGPTGPAGHGHGLVAAPLALSAVGLGGHGLLGLGGHGLALGGHGLALGAHGLY
ncbi:hypothetical protein NQ314_012991 [Rhamnusium bicolor]|uniref:Uncharacterized protein n=1 Tax=Rhamnusium bicolor TaxID=1586634 RepID=A0AAV8X9D9_9CUCU|nr:hypothetical protein NQ314_012991 [Rhamnusium bicolor]